MGSLVDGARDDPLARAALAVDDHAPVRDRGLDGVGPLLPRLGRHAAEPHRVDLAERAVRLQQPVRRGEREGPPDQQQHRVPADLDHRGQPDVRAPVPGQLCPIDVDGRAADVVDPRALALGADLQLFARQALALQTAGVDHLTGLLSREGIALAPDEQGSAAVRRDQGTLAEAPGFRDVVGDDGGDGRGGGRAGGGAGGGIGGGGGVARRGGHRGDRSVLNYDPLSVCDAPAIPHVNSFQTASKWIG